MSEQDQSQSVVSRRSFLTFGRQEYDESFVDGADSELIASYDGLLEADGEEAQVVEQQVSPGLEEGSLHFLLWEPAGSYLATTRRSVIQFSFGISASLLLSRVGVQTGNAGLRQSLENTLPTLGEDNTETLNSLKARSDELGSESVDAVEEVQGSQGDQDAVREELARVQGQTSYIGGRGPVYEAFSLSVQAPLVEETLFRALPALFADYIEGDRSWKIGVPSTLLFGFWHNFYVDWEGNPSLNTNILPIGQLTLGSFAWWLAKNEGLPHSYYAHSLHNTSVLALLHLARSN